MSPLIPLYLSQTIFGLLYALLIHWLGMRNWLRGQTAWSVVIGDGMTLFIQWLFFRESWNPFVTLGSFAFTGTPMVITYLIRHQLKMDQAKHSRRPWPTAALKAREDALMDITKMIHNIEDAANRKEITPGFLLTLSNELHGVKKVLSSV